MTATGLRLGVYADLRYERRGDGVACDTAFVRFLAALGRHTDRLAVFGRSGAVAEPVAVLRDDEAEFVALPDYPSLADVRAVARAMPGSRAAWRRELGTLDAVLVFGPHPLAMALARDARAAGVPVVLGVRQYLPEYLGRRSSGPSSAAVGAVASGLERCWQRLARRTPTIVTGADLARRYRGAARLLDVTFSLVDEIHIVDRPSSTLWATSATALSVGRLDPEKNPLLLADIAAGLRRAWPGWSVRAVGGGSCADELADRGRVLDAADWLQLPGAVPFGDALRLEYAAADALLHVSHTEGQPQVLLEAMAAGLPIVATAVGGVPSMIGADERGLLVPPDDARAAIAALERLRSDPALRDRLVAAGREHVRHHTSDVEAARVVAFVGEAAR